MPERSYPPDWPVSKAIDTLIRATLRDHPDLVEGPAIKMAERPDVARHVGKRWGDLSEGEQNIIAREVGLVAAVATQPPHGGKH